jgi:hypothetical protein
MGRAARPPSADPSLYADSRGGVPARDFDTRPVPQRRRGDLDFEEQEVRPARRVVRQEMADPPPYSKAASSMSRSMSPDPKRFGRGERSVMNEDRRGPGAQVPPAARVPPSKPVEVKSTKQEPPSRAPEPIVDNSARAGGR